MTVEESLRLQGAGWPIALGHIEDHGVGVELRRGVAVDRTGGVMLELRGDKLPGSFGGMVAADPGLVYRSNSSRAKLTARGGLRARGRRRQQAPLATQTSALKTWHPNRHDVRRGRRSFRPALHTHALRDAAQAARLYGDLAFGESRKFSALPHRKDRTGRKLPCHSPGGVSPCFQ